MIAINGDKKQKFWVYMYPYIKEYRGKLILTAVTSIIVGICVACQPLIKQQKRYGHKGNNSFELKISVAHEGWKETAPKRFELANKTVVCDIANGTEFNKRKEAVLSSKYNTDEINMRIFNSDGEWWIKKLHDYNDEAHFQLDPFHIQKAIKSSNPGGDYTKQVSIMLRENRIDELFEYLEAVANSLEDEKSEEKVRQFLGYLKENRDGLVPYQKRGLKLPKLPDGLVYRGMGM